MDVKSEFKQTETATIPEDWQLLPMLSVVRIANGQVDPKVDPYRSMILVAPDHIEAGSGGLLKKETAREQRAISGKYQFAKGDIVYSKIRPYLRKAILADFDGLCSADMYPLKPADAVSAGFIFAAILAHHFSKYAEAVSVRSGMPKINRAELAAYTIALPPTKLEQEAIAKALRDVDALIEALEKLLAKKRQLKHGAMRGLLTGRKRLPGFRCDDPSYRQTKLGRVPAEWTPTSLQQMSMFITKGSTPTTYGFAWQKDGILFLRSECVSGNGLDLSQSMFISDGAHKTLKRSEVRAGDVLMTITGNVGRVVHLQRDFGEANINQHIARIRIVDAQVSDAFVFHFLSQEVVRNYYNLITTGQAYPQISLAQVRDTEVPLPSLAEQRAIATVLSAMDAEITTLEEKLNKVRHLQQGMMQELLTGRIRLV